MNRLLPTLFRSSYAERAIRRLSIAIRAIRSIALGSRSTPNRLPSSFHNPLAFARPNSFAAEGQIADVDTLNREWGLTVLVAPPFGVGGLWVPDVNTIPIDLAWRGATQADP